MMLVYCAKGFGPNNNYYTLDDLINNEPVPYLDDETDNYLFLLYMNNNKNRLYIYKINKNTNRIVSYTYKLLNFLI